jgi:hypothetical protein
VRLIEFHELGNALGVDNRRGGIILLCVRLRYSLPIMTRRRSCGSGTYRIDHEAGNGSNNSPSLSPKKENTERLCDEAFPLLSRPNRDRSPAAVPRRRCRSIAD